MRACVYILYEDWCHGFVRDLKAWRYGEVVVGVEILDVFLSGVYVFSNHC